MFLAARCLTGETAANIPSVNRETTRGWKAPRTVLDDSFLHSCTFLGTPPEVLKSAKPILIHNSRRGYTLERTQALPANVPVSGEFLEFPFKRTAGGVTPYYSSWPHLRKVAKVEKEG